MRKNIIDFGVFYTCYNEIKSVEFSIALLRKVYPNVPIFLVSDGGADFSYLRNIFPSIQTSLEADSRGFIPKIDQFSFRESSQQTMIISSIRIFLDRLERAVDFCGKEWMLVMEPDVLVRGPLSRPEFGSLLGSRINEGISDALTTVAASIFGSIRVSSWGATPALLNTKAFKKSKAVLTGIPGFLSELTLLDHRFANYDMLLPVMFGLIGEAEVVNDDITECFRATDWHSNGKPLVHQFRAFYPSRAAGYTGRQNASDWHEGPGLRGGEGFLSNVFNSFPDIKELMIR